jgi:IS605 OrfB family transposase
MAFKNFFRRCKKGDAKKGYPKFKTRKRSKLSFQMDGTRVKVRGHWLKLDYTHKMTTGIARTYRIIGVEDLNVPGMLRNRRLALSIADAGFGETQRQLRYKSEWYGGILVEVDRFFPSSRLCPMCGGIKSDLTLRDRMFICACGYTADRDVNAAQNIEREALRLMNRGRSGFTDSLNGRGQDIRPLEAIPDEASKWPKKGGLPDLLWFR